MSERFDDVAKMVVERTPRRMTLLGLGALALGLLGGLGVGWESEAKNNNNQCNVCKRRCQQYKQQQGTKQQRHCHDHCNTKCNDKAN